MIINDKTILMGCSIHEQKREMFVPFRDNIFFRFSYDESGKFGYGFCKVSDENQVPIFPDVAYVDFSSRCRKFDEIVESVCRLYEQQRNGEMDESFHTLRDAVGTQVLDFFMDIHDAGCRKWINV